MKELNMKEVNEVSGGTSFSGVIATICWLPGFIIAGVGSIFFAPPLNSS